MYGRPPVGKAFFGVLANGSGSGHVYGLEMRPVAAGPDGERGSNSNHVWTCMDGPLSARLFLVFWQTDRGAVMYTASRCGQWPRALMENADRIPIIARSGERRGGKGGS